MESCAAKNVKIKQLEELKAQTKTEMEKALIEVKAQLKKREGIMCRQLNNPKLKL